MVRLSFLALFLLLAVAFTQSTDTSVRDLIYAKFSIPENASRVLFLDQSAHLDWDWQNWFSTNVNNTYPPDYNGYFNSNQTQSPQPSDSIFYQVSQLVNGDSRYHYSNCEISFLQGFQQDHPDLFAIFTDNTDRVRMIGGGITSPDNTVSNGEAFIRNYLTASVWMDNNSFPNTRQIWLPDDFGHDSQLPVLLNAINAEAVGFARVPGACDQSTYYFADNQKDAAQLLLDPVTGGVDFFWQAADGSTTLAHWLQAHYSQGADIAEQDYIFNGVTDNLNCSASLYATTPSEHISGYYATNGPVSNTKYIYVPVMDDFTLPVGGTYYPNSAQQDLLQYIDDWNSQSYPTTGLYVVNGNFDYYVQLVLSEGADLLKNRSYHGADTMGIKSSQNPSADLKLTEKDAAETLFRPNPYWMGYYASRPVLKVLHNEVSRQLLAAESLSVFSQLLEEQYNDNVPPSDQDRLFNAWNYYVTSTHHDFITGTAIDYVYDGSYQGQDGEQWFRLNNSIQTASDMVSEFSQRIANGIPASSNLDVAAINVLGFARDGIAAVTFSSLSDDQQTIIDKAISMGHVQQSVEDQTTYYYTAYAPSLGYNTTSMASLLTNGPRPESQRSSVKASPDGTSYTLTNQYLSAVISSDYNYGIESLIDLATGLELVQPGANQLNVWNDNGNIYRFGYEMPGCLFEPAQFNITAGSSYITGYGPLVNKVVGTVSIQGDDLEPANYTVTYELRADEAFVRVTWEGLARNYTSVFVNIALNDALNPFNEIIHGTTYHWDYKYPLDTFGENQEFNSSFWPTHNFVIPVSYNTSTNEQTPLLAVLHGGDVGAWANSGSDLVGTLFRNTPGNGCDGYGADGHDNGVHTLKYAIRVPTGLSSPESSNPLQESLKFQTEFIALPVTSSDGPYPTEFSFATVNSPSSVILTAAKAKTTDNEKIILRAYNAANTPATLNITLAGTLENGGDILVVSALEREIHNNPFNFTSTGVFADDDSYTFTVDAPYALTTVKIG